MEVSFGLHYQKNLAENSWCAVIGLSLPSGLEATLPVTLHENGFFSQIFLMLDRPEINFVCSGRQRRLKTRIGAERAQRV